MQSNEHMMRPGEIVAVDDDGVTTPEGRMLAKELVECARGCESRFGELRAQMRDYEAWWRQRPTRWTSGRDDELAKTLPSFPNAKGRILAAKVVRANVKERVAYRITTSAEWLQKQKEATQQLERYCYGALWMADQERTRRMLGQLQPTLAWMGAVRGGAIAIPFVRKSPRQQDGDQYGTLEPYVIRTPDPYTCVWVEGSYGLTFFASSDWRPQSDFYGMAELADMRPRGEKGHEEECEVTNVWWCDCDRQVWNATIVEGSHFLIPPTNHSAARRLARLPVVIDTPGFGSPKEVSIEDSDTISLADHYQGVLENNLNAYAVEAYLDSINMRMMQDYAQFLIAIAAETQLTAEDVKNAFQGNALIQLGKDGRIYTVAPPQVSDSLVRWKTELDARQQLGGMPNTAVAGITDGMTGVAIQEALLQGDFVAGPVSDMLKRMHEEIAHCLIHQHRSLGRKISVRGIDAAQGMFIARVDASQLPPFDDYMLEAIHKPGLVRDGYRQAQEAATWKNTGRSWESIAEEMFPDPIREVRLSLQEQLDGLPEVKLANLLAEAITKYGKDSPATKAVALMLQQRLAQTQGQPGATNAPAPGAAMDAEPMPQLPGGPAMQMPAGMNNPQEPVDQEAMGEMGRMMGGERGY